MVEQSFIDMPDLLNPEGAETQPARFWWTSGHFDSENLKRLQQVQNYLIVNRQGIGSGVAPMRSSWPTLKKRKSIWIEQVSTVGRQSQSIVFHSAKDRPKGRKQSTPCIRAT